MLPWPPEQFRERTALQRETNVANKTLIKFSYTYEFYQLIGGTDFLTYEVGFKDNALNKIQNKFRIKSKINSMHISN